MEMRRATATLLALRHMSLIPACLSLLLFAANLAVGGSAFEALKFLTPEQIHRVALIAGRDGTPEPERWYIVVHDPASAETGLREIVVANGKKVAERQLSQFAEKISASDVLPPDALKVDSERVGKMAMKFGAVNSSMVSAMHFDLRKTGPESVPLWTVTCLDSSGVELGKLIVSASRGTVLMHPGFVAEPDLDSIAESPQFSMRTSESPGAEENARVPRNTIATPLPFKRRATPFPGATPKPGFLQRLFNPDKPKPPPR